MGDEYQRMNEHQLTLNDYQVVNLRQAFVLLNAVGGDTGDWFHEIIQQLNRVETGDIAPNKTGQDQKRDLALKVGWGALFT